MKETTKWDNKPRWMWVWDVDEKDKIKKYVVYILTKEEIDMFAVSYPVKTAEGQAYYHCAEIEEETTYLTNYELSQLLKCFGVERSTRDSNVEHAYNDLSYSEGTDMEGVKIRYKQSSWEEPTRETVWKWCGKAAEDIDISRFISFMGWTIQ